MSEMIIPAYEAGSLSNILSSVCAQLQVAGCIDRIGLPAAERYVVFLIDGLGFELLKRYRNHAPYLFSLVTEPLTTGVPSTTVTSITSLGTGLTPGQHGLPGFSFRAAAELPLFSPLFGQIELDPYQLQPQPTLFTRAENIQAAVVSPAAFAQSCLTLAALRPRRYYGCQDDTDATERHALVLQALADGARLVYAYERHLDHSGHRKGVASPRWASQLRDIDAACEDLRDALPDDVRLIITGDHGMIDVPQSHRVCIEDEPTLFRGLTMIGGEARFRHLYTEDANDVAERWRGYWKQRAWIRTREEAVGEGWFGQLKPEFQDRFGDVVVAMRQDWAALTLELPGEFHLVGMHGSLTPEEMLIPLLVD